MRAEPSRDGTSLTEPNRAGLRRTEPGRAEPPNFVKAIYCSQSLEHQGIGCEFGSAGAVCSIKESSGLQNQRVHILIKASKLAGAKGDVPKI